MLIYFIFKALSYWGQRGFLPFNFCYHLTQENVFLNPLATYVPDQKMHKPVVSLSLALQRHLISHLMMWPPTEGCAENPQRSALERTGLTRRERGIVQSLAVDRCFMYDMETLGIYTHSAQVHKRK